MKDLKREFKRQVRTEAKEIRASLRKRRANSLASAEEKIKEAARKLFTKEGFEAVKTRDIAQEAGINLALLNYYFRSKEKLFEIIMLENIGHFFEGITAILNDEKTDFYKKIELLVDFYISRLTDNPDVPLFVLNEARNNPEKLPLQINLLDTRFIKQFEAEIKDGRVQQLNPAHLMMNMLGLTVFPFAARPMIQRIRHINDEDFHKMMNERRKLIPQWIKAMLETRGI